MMIVWILIAIVSSTSAFIDEAALRDLQTIGKQSLLLPLTKAILSSGIFQIIGIHFALFYQTRLMNASISRRNPMIPSMSSIKYYEVAIRMCESSSLVHWVK